MWFCLWWQLTVNPTRLEGSMERCPWWINVNNLFAFLRFSDWCHLISMSKLTKHYFWQGTMNYFPCVTLTWLTSPFAVNIMACACTLSQRRTMSQWSVVLPLKCQKQCHLGCIELRVKNLKKTWNQSFWNSLFRTSTTAKLLTNCRRTDTRPTNPTYQSHAWQKIVTDS